MYGRKDTASYFTVVFASVNEFKLLDAHGDSNTISFQVTSEMGWRYPGGVGNLFCTHFITYLRYHREHIYREQ